MFSCCVDTVGLLVDRTRVVAGFNHTPTYQARGRGTGQAPQHMQEQVVKSVT